MCIVPSVLLLLLNLGVTALIASPRITSEDLPLTAAPGALGASLTTSATGEVWLSWVEPAKPPAGTTPAAGGAHQHQHGAAPSGDPNTLRFAVLAAGAKAWSAPRTIAHRPDIPKSSADFPQLVLDGAGRAFALWVDGRGGALLTASSDRGVTWSPPVPWTHDSDVVEKFSFARLENGRVLAAWLDGRGRKADGGAQRLYARILGDPAPDVRIDASVCDCCPTSLAAFPDGGALLAYRGRTADEIRDIRVARFLEGKWSEPRILNHDGWRIAACPINGPRLASYGGRVAATWFTAVNDLPRVMASYSSDAGERFLMPLEIDNGNPAGRVDTLVLRHGGMLVSWVENDGSVWLRRVSPAFSAAEPVALTPPGAVSNRTVPRLALLHDFSGGRSSAEVLAVFAVLDVRAPLRTMRITVPEGELLAEENDCNCSAAGEALLGFPIDGTIAAVSTDAGSVSVSHRELPGIFAAGTREFRALPHVLSLAQAGRKFRGRIDRRDGVWWLLDAQLLRAEQR